MGNAKKRRFWKNREKAILKLSNEKTEKQISHPNKRLNTMENREKHSIIESKFDRNSNNVPMLETSNKVDE